MKVVSATKTFFLSWTNGKQIYIRGKAAFGCIKHRFEDASKMCEIATLGKFFSSRQSQYILRNKRRGPYVVHDYFVGVVIIR